MWKNLENILNLNIVQKFLEKAEEPNILTKDLGINELKLLFDQFPNLFPIVFQQYIIENANRLQDSSVVKVITLVKNKKDAISLSKVSKLKIYYDNLNSKILKILNL